MCVGTHSCALEISIHVGVSSCPVPMHGGQQRMSSVLFCHSRHSLETRSLIGSEPCGFCQAGSQRVPRTHLSPPHDNGGSAWPCLLVWMLEIRPYCWVIIQYWRPFTPPGLLISCSGFSSHGLVGLVLREWVVRFQNSQSLVMFREVFGPQEQSLKRLGDGD